MAHEELPPVNITPGAIRFNTDSMKLEYFRIGMEGGDSSSYAGIGTVAAGEWVQITTDSPELHTGGTRGLKLGGYTAPGSGGSEADIDYFNIATTGNATKWGDAGSEGNQYAGFSASDRTRGVFGGGNSSSVHTGQVHVKYVEIASEGTVEDFGDLSTSVTGATKGLNGNSTRGLISGGNGNAIEYITIQTTGNFQTFGDLAVSTNGTENTAGFCNSVKSIQAGGIHASGASTGTTNAIGYVHTATLGNSAFFGDLSAARWHICGASNSVRGILWNGMTSPSAATGTNTIEYLELSSLGDAVDFGDTSHNVRSRGAAASPTRSVAFGGADPTINTMDYVQIASKGDAIDFGDLTQITEAPMMASNGHGGLG